MSFLNTLTGGFSASAKVVDGTLILSLPDALSPVVWRMDLGHVRSSAIEVRAQDDGLFMLTLKTPKGDVNDIAPYATRARAVAALVAVTRAMEQAHGAIRPAGAAHDSGGAPARGDFRPGHLVTGIAGLCLVIALIVLLTRLSPAPPVDPAASEAAWSGGPSAAGFGAPPPGQPVSADEFLRSR